MFAIISTKHQKVQQDKYFLTGDLGYIDRDGKLHFKDRKKDIIIKGGVNVGPNQIDEILQAHPSVKEAATVAKPDQFLGETIKAYIVLKEGQSADGHVLAVYCRGELGVFKTPSEFEFVESLPKGPSGKIIKRELRKKSF